MSELTTLIELNKKVLIAGIKESFIQRGFVVSELSLLEYEQDNIKMKIMVGGDKIILEKHDGNMRWTLNAIQKGEVFGHNLSDVASDYEYAQAANKK